FIPTETVDMGGASRYLDQTLAAIGYARQPAPARESGPNVEPRVGGAVPEPRVGGAMPEPETPAPEAAPAFRERNRPGEGRARRTKEEIAEDKDLDVAAGEAGVSDGTVDE